MELALVNTNITKVMKYPKNNCEMIDELLHGYVVEVIQDMGEWIKIKSHYKYVGYCHKNNFINDINIIEIYKKKQKYFINNNSVDVLKFPKDESYSIKNLTIGCFVNIIDVSENNFSKVLLSSKEVGYIKTKFLSKYVDNHLLYTEDDFRQKIITTAQNYLGTQYRWGGKTTRGIDCSGLTSITYMLNGVVIYRDASIHNDFPIKKIEMMKIKKGDLLFFDKHVGIYIDDGIFIHSSRSINGVGFNSINTKHSNFRQDLLDSFVCAGSIF